LLDLLAHANQFVVCLASEAASKLLFAERIDGTAILAQLLVMFFDPYDKSNDDDGDSATKQIGNPIRLQQLLSIFFNAYCMKSEACCVNFVDCLGDALKLAEKRKKPQSARKKIAFAYMKMIEYCCETAESAMEAHAKELAGSVPIETTPSIFLLACCHVAKFLSDDTCSLTTTQTRALCKFMGSQEIDAQEDSLKHLIELREVTEEIGMLITDEICLQSLSPLNEDLAAVQQRLEEEEKEQENNLIQDNDQEDTSLGGTTVEDSLMESFVRLEVGSENEGTGMARGKRSSSRSGQRSSSGLGVLDSSNPNVVAGAGVE